MVDWHCQYGIIEYVVERVTRYCQVYSTMI